MTREEFLQFLTKKGFDLQQAAGIAADILHKFAAQGKSSKEALIEIAQDLQSGGEIAKYLEDIKKSLLNAYDAESFPKVCPNCGKPRSAAVPGITKPGECAHCGIIFDKIKSVAIAQSDAAAAPDADKSISPTPPATHVPKPSDSPASSFAGNKWMAIIALLAAVAFILTPVIQSNHKRTFKETLKTFDEKLDMTTQEGFKSSLDNLQYVIETASMMLAKRGWSRKNVEWFYEETQSRLNRFLDMMEKTVAGADTLYDQDTSEIRQNLGSGMHLLLLSIRNEDARLAMLGRSSYAVDTSDPDYDPEQNIRRGNYVAYDPEQYTPSSRIKIVRKGNKITIRERTKSEIETNKATQEFLAGNPQEEITAADKENAEAFKRVQAEISLMQFNYRRTHDGIYCGDLRELIANHLSMERATVSQETINMINSGVIAIELKNDGRSYELLDLRKK